MRQDENIKKDDKPIPDSKHNYLEFELNLKALMASLEEQQKNAEELKRMISDKDKAIAELSSKIENLLQEQKYEIIELVHSLSKNIRNLGERGKGQRSDDEVSRLINEKIEKITEAKNAELDGLRNNLQELKNQLYKQSLFIGQYRGSIVFPLYRMTSGIGKTSIGNKLQKLKKPK
jgi:iron-sulfur cluster repair protein YtfE (RIC family)